MDLLLYYLNIIENLLRPLLALMSSLTMLAPGAAILAPASNFLDVHWDLPHLKSASRPEIYLLLFPEKVKIGDIS